MSRISIPGGGSGGGGSVTDAAMAGALGSQTATAVAGRAELKAAYVPRSADGFASPKALPLPPQPLRLGTYRTANSRPVLTATNQPVPSANFTEYSFATGAPSNFTYWGSTTYGTNGQGIPGAFGSANPGGIWAPPWVLEFITDSLTFAVKLSTGNSYFQVLVDEEIVYEASTPPTGGAWVQFAWSGARRLRRYRLFGALAVQTVRTSVSDSVFATDPQGPLVAWVTDSYGQVGGRAPHTLDGYVRMASAMLGWRYAQNADGGTGYGQAGTVGTQTFLQRVPQVIAANPDAVVWAGGHNMSSTEMANGFTGLRASAAAVFSAARAGLGNCPMWALGPLSQSTTFQTNNAAAWDQLALACADYGVTFIDTRGWVMGTGYEGAPANDGNADALVSTDNTHYNAYSAEYVAVRMYESIRTSLGGY